MAGRSRRGRDARRPALAWGVPFTLVIGILLVRNAFLITTPEYEEADMGANSILIEQARRFTLLVGNYSRERFHHPGPAFLYVQAWGESVFYDALHLVPTPWNGQVIALYALNALFAACAVAVGYGWTRSVRGAAIVIAVTLGYGAAHPAMFSWDWMPYEYVPAYFAFLLSVASVAAGGTRDAWIAALSGWFLIHGHACFLFFVPLLTLGALAAVAWRHRGPGWPRTWGAVRAAAWRTRRAWLPVAVISAIFALPIVADLVLHWPGNFGKYLAYSSSARAGGHAAAHVAAYVLWFWWPGEGAWAVAAVLVLAAAVITWRLPAGPVRRLCVALLAFDALSTAAFIVYTVAGIDMLRQHYIGYFYWSAPVVVALVITLGGTELLAAARLPGSGQRASLATMAAAALATALAVVAVVAFAVAPQTTINVAHVDPLVASDAITDPALPAGMAKLAADSGGRPVVLTFAHDAWPIVTGLLVQAERTGVTACVARHWWLFMMTSQFICTPAQRAAGRGYHIYLPGTVPHGARVVFRFSRGVVTALPGG